ncbi:MAG TPA: aminotransferase class IV [Vicinamibacterales bacterium]|nr:aminotransferase class IV [Vicinamibacterales bacterium]
MITAAVNVNGRVSDAEHAGVSVLDHGFLYGYGVYETLRTYDRVPFLFDRHMKRLRASAEGIHVRVPVDDAEMLRRIERTMAAVPGLQEGYIRILLTRGVGDFSYDPKSAPDPTLVIIVKNFPEPPAEKFDRGIELATVSVMRNHPASVNPRIKSNNLLNNALAMQEALRKGAEEALLKNHRDEVAECAQSNVFIIRNGAALTPPLDSGLLAGITREFVFEVGRTCGVPVSDAVLRESDVLGADEVFITGTTRELTPVVAIDRRTIGDGKPGPITKKLLARFREMARQSVAAMRH